MWIGFIAQTRIVLRHKKEGVKLHAKTLTLKRTEHNIAGVQKSQVKGQNTLNTVYGSCTKSHVKGQNKLNTIQQLYKESRLTCQIRKSENQKGLV